MRCLICTFQSLLLLTICFAVRSVNAADEIETLELAAGFPRWGLSPSLLSYRWAVTPVTVGNSSSRSQNIIVRLSPTDRLDSDVYEYRLTPGPASRCTYNLLMQPENAVTYTVTSAKPGEPYFSRETIPSQVESAYGKNAIFFITDDMALSGISDLDDVDGLSRNVEVTRTPSRQAPQHVLGYGGASMVVMCDIDPGQWGEAQFGALRGFVAGGGTLLFAAPSAVLTLRDTCFSEFFPAYPLRMRSITTLPEPDQWRAMPGEPSDEVLGRPAGDESASAWRVGAGSLLEMAPVARAEVSASAAGIPLFCWKKFGHGRVGICAVDPFDRQNRERPLGVQLWNHIFTWQTTAPLNTNAIHSKPLKEAAERLVGFSAPKAGEIGKVLVLYFFLLALLFLLGSVLRRQAWGWGVAGLAALALTAGIFATAYRKASGEDSHVFTALKVALRSNKGVWGESVLGLFSKSDLRLDLHASQQGVRFRGLPPVTSLFAKSGRSEAPLTLVRKDGCSFASALNLQALKPLRLSAYFEGAPPTDADSLPVSLTPGGWTFGEHSEMNLFPADAKLYLVFQNGFRRVTREAGRFVVRRGGADALQLDPVLTSIEGFLKNGAFPSPSLVAVYDKESPLAWLKQPNPEFRQTQKCIDAFPCTLRLPDAPGAEVLVDSAAITIEPGDKGSGTMYYQGEWQEMRTYGTGAEYLFDAVLPPEMAPGMSIDEIELAISIIDPAASVECIPALMPVQAAGAGDGAPRAQVIEPTEKTGGAYVFRDLNKQRLMDPATGRIHMLLKVSSKMSAVSGARQLTPGRWRIKEFRVTVRGRTK